MQRITVIAFLIFIAGCKTEENGRTTSVIVNRTNYIIDIIPFIGSTQDPAMRISLRPSDSQVVYQANVPGKTIDPSFGTLLQPYDSVLVQFHSTVRIPHIKFNTPYAGTHFIPFTSNRSISNNNNWEKHITRETETSIEGYHKYIFTEQDYIDAQ